MVKITIHPFFMTVHRQTIVRGHVSCYSGEKKTLGGDRI